MLYDGWRESPTPYLPPHPRWGDFCPVGGMAYNDREGVAEEDVSDPILFALVDGREGDAARRVLQILQPQDRAIPLKTIPFGWRLAP